MEGRMRPYLPELTIRDYNTYLWYLRGVRWQMSRSYGFYSCRLLQHNGVLFALLADSLAGRSATCVNQRLPGTLCYRQMMCQTQGIRLAAQVEVMMGWHKLQDRRWDELPLRNQLFRAVDHALLRRAYEKAVNENPALERLFGQEQAQAVAGQRRSQVGSGMRNERIRTYNFPQGRVTDHRIGLTLYKIDAIMDGNLDELIDALVTADQAEKLQSSQSDT